MKTRPSVNRREDFLTRLRHANAAWLTSVLLIFDCVPAWAGAKGGDEETFRNVHCRIGGNG